MTPSGRKLFRLPWRSAKQIRADVDDELGFHLAERVDALVALGLTADAARAQALREFGDIDDARQYIGAVDHDIEAAQRRSDFMSDLYQDIIYSARKLRSAPGFTLAVIITLALGIGANTAIFSVVNGVLLKPLPFAAADHLVRFRFTQQGHGDAGTPMDLVDYRTQSKTLEGVAVAEGTTANLTRESADAERIPGVKVSTNWFDLLRVKPLAGRLFQAADEQPEAPNVVVLSEQLWRRDFSGDAGIIGKAVRINAKSFTVIGVVPAALRYPVTVELWMPERFTSQELSDQSRGARWLAYIARVKDNVDVATASAEVRAISEVMEKRFPEDFRERRAALVTVHDFLVGDMRKPLFLMLGAVFLVLLIACANVANLLLVRATARQSEIAIRTALGAGRGRLVRQLMTESVMLAVIGGLAGVGLARLGMAKLLAMAPSTLLFVDRASIDGRTLAVTAVISLLTGLIFGALPAVQTSRTELTEALRAGGRGTRSLPSANRTKRIIVVGELALAVTLLSGAGLLLHSFSRLVSVDPGFRPEGTLSMRLSLPPSSYDTTAVRAFVANAETRLRGLPGVQSAALTSIIPFDGNDESYSFTVRGRTYARPSDEPDAQVVRVTPDYFRTLGIPVRRGRVIEPGDLASAPRIYVVNEAFAKRFFPNEDVIGQEIRLGWGNDPKGVMNQIVGVVANVRTQDLGEDPAPMVYASLAQYPSNGMGIVVRSSGPPANYTAPIRALLKEIDREIPVHSVQTMEERVAGSVGRQKFYASLIAVFAGVALVLAAVGLYGVIAYMVSQRTHELGVRVALGATTDHISRMVIGEGLRLTAAGVAIGVVASLALGRLVSTLLFGITPRDPLTLVVVVAALGGVATLASWLPARRAARVDPLVAMRGD